MSMLEEHMTAILKETPRANKNLQNQNLRAETTDQKSLRWK